MGNTWSQFFPPSPSLTEANLPRQDGKVFIVTGGAAGIGFELCSILYRAGGKVYLAGRSEENARNAISRIKKQASTAAGDLLFLQLSLDDLTTIKPAVDHFLRAESRLDVLFNNAGVSNPPVGSRGAQGHELQMATNCLGPWLLTQLLVPTLVATAKTTNPNTTRVIWTSSITTEFTSTSNSPEGSIDISHLSDIPSNQQLNYTTSKTGNWLLADALAKQIGRDGVVSVTQNPGNLKTTLTRHFSALVPLLVSPLLYHARYGAYTALWSAFSPELTVEDGGKYVIPWGRLHPSPREDVTQAMKTREEGGTGVAAIFVEWCSNQTAGFM